MVCGTRGARTASFTVLHGITSAVATRTAAARRLGGGNAIRSRSRLRWPGPPP